MASVSNSITFVVNNITFEDKSGLVNVIEPPEKRNMFGYKIPSFGAHVFIKNIILKNYDNSNITFMKLKT